MIFINQQSLYHQVALQILKQQKKMKKNIIALNPDKKKLVIANYRINQLQSKSQQKKIQLSVSTQQLDKNKEQQQQLQVRKRAFTNQNCANSKLLPTNPPNNKITYKKIRDRQETNFTLKNERRLERSKSTGQSIQLNSRFMKNFCYFKNAPKMRQQKNSPEVREIFSILVQFCAIQEKNTYFVTAQKQSFIEILHFILNFPFINQPDREECQSSYPHLRAMFLKLHPKLIDFRKQKRSSRLALRNNVHQLRYSNQNYRKSMTDNYLNLETLLNKNNCLEEKLTCIKKQSQMVTQLLQQRKVQILEMQKRNDILTVQIQQKLSNINILNNQIKEKTRALQKVKQDADKIYNFVQQQEEKKILHWVSQAYKNIESEIYDYATYLQCNSMASSLTWQPKPFRAVEKWVFEQMERVNKFIMSKSQSTQLKSIKMKEFITNTTRKFKTKDEQMTKIVDYKTECIKKFIKMMQKWMQNWQLKQEYLVSLRNQFAFKSQQINKLFDRCKDVDGNYSLLIYVVDSITTTWKSLQKNYKYGNSFY